MKNIKLKTASKAWLYLTSCSRDAESMGVEIFYDRDEAMAHAKEDFESVVEAVFDETELEYDQKGNIDVDEDFCFKDGSWFVNEHEGEFDTSWTHGEVVEIDVEA